MDKKTIEEHPILATKGQTLVYAQPQLATTETKGPLLTLGHKVANKKENVPERAQEEVIWRHYDRSLHRHPGQDKTLEKIQRNYHFDGMKCKVTEFIHNCEQCAKNKLSRHKPYRQAQQIDLPKAPWKTITMDFVVKLPKSTDPATKVVYNSIKRPTQRVGKPPRATKNNHLRSRQTLHLEILEHVDKATWH